MGRKHSEATKLKQRLSNLGKKRSLETRQRVSAAKRGTTYANRGEKHHLWKGKAVGLHALHDWVRYHKGKATHCVECGSTNSPPGNNKWFEWANISGEYRRDLDDFKSLCRPCHAKFDNIITHITRKPNARNYKYVGCKKPSHH